MWNPHCLMAKLPFCLRLPTFQCGDEGIVGGGGAETSGIWKFEWDYPILLVMINGKTNGKPWGTHILENTHLEMHRFKKKSGKIGDAKPIGISGSNSSSRTCGSWHPASHTHAQIAIERLHHFVLDLWQADADLPHWHTPRHQVGWARKGSISNAVTCASFRVNQSRS